MDYLIIIFATFGFVREERTCLFSDKNWNRVGVFPFTEIILINEKKEKTKEIRCRSVTLFFFFTFRDIDNLKLTRIYCVHEYRPNDTREKDWITDVDSTLSVCGHRTEVRDHGYVYEGTDIIAFCRTMEETTALSTATSRYFRKQQVVRRRTFSCLVSKELKNWKVIVFRDLEK